MNNILLLIFLLLVNFYAYCQNPVDDKKMYVRVIYLVSNDKSPNQEFVESITSTLKNIQEWYKLQLDGASFILHPEGVRLINAGVESSYFANTPNGEDKSKWGILNCEKIAKHRAGAHFLDPTSIWAVYSDSSGWGGQGGSGFTCMPEEDLYGLIGRNKSNLNVNRWIGGAAHELGHAFGLNHPLNNVETNKALMAYGWHSDYPNSTFFTDDEKEKLRSSPFFYANGISVLGKIVDKFYYPSGWFEKRENGFWYEYKYDNSFSLKFTLSSEERNTITLFDSSRNLFLRVPKSEGMAYFSINNKENWKYVFKISRKNKL